MIMNDHRLSALRNNVFISSDGTASPAWAMETSIAKTAGCENKWYPFFFPLQKFYVFHFICSVLSQIQKLLMLLP